MIFISKTTLQPAPMLDVPSLLLYLRAFPATPTLKPLPPLRLRNPPHCYINRYTVFPCNSRQERAILLTPKHGG